MGNTQKQNPANYLCNYDTPPSSVLSQTSLHPLCHKTCIKTAGLTVCSPENKENVPQTSPNTRIQLECSTQKKNIKKCPRSDTKQFLTENDFHILKVCYFYLNKSNCMIGSWNRRVWKNVSSEKEWWWKTVHYEDGRQKKNSKSWLFKFYRK